MLSISTTAAVPESKADNGANFLINMMPELGIGVDFKCTRGFCYGIGPIHRVLVELQHQISRLAQLNVDGFVGPATVKASRMAADQTMAQVLQRDVHLASPAFLLLTVAQAGMYPQDLARFAVPLTQIFKLGADLVSG